MMPPGPAVALALVLAGLHDTARPALLPQVRRGPPQPQGSGGVPAARRRKRRARGQQRRH